MVDGNGVLHPRGFGCASHIGVICDIPTVGIGKTLQHVDGLDERAVRELCVSSKLSHGESVPLIGDSGRTWGVALRSSHAPKGSTGEAVYKFKPIFVSIGHNISLSSALTLAIACCKHRIPEPVRLADLEGRDVIRAREATVTAAPV